MFYRFRRRLQSLLPRINIEIIYKHDLGEILPIETKIPVYIERLSAENIHRINEVKKLNIKRLLKRLERGDECYVAYSLEKNKTVSYHWVQYKGYHFIQQAGKHVKMEDGEACIYHVRVADAFKGNRINGCVYREILKDAKRNNLKKVWVYTNFYNYANQKGLENVGFLKESKIYSLKFNGKYYQFFKKKFDV